MVFIVREHEGTRDRVHRLVSATGPVTAAEIGRQLGLTPAAVRRHLDALQDDGRIQVRDLPRTGRHARGRPARAYVLSPAGHDALRATYDDVATSALRYLADRAGEQAVADFARERMAAFEARYAARLADLDATHPDGAASPAQRAEALAASLTEDGFAASVRDMPGPPGPSGRRDTLAAGGTTRSGVQLCQGHCPVQHVAAEFPQLCDAETDAFSRLLGVHVQRLATLAHGEHVCTTYVPLPPRSPAGTPPQQPAARHTEGEPR